MKRRKVVSSLAGAHSGSSILPCRTLTLECGHTVRWESNRLGAQPPRTVKCRYCDVVLDGAVNFP